MTRGASIDHTAPQNLSAGIYATLRHRLILGELRPGASLSIRTLAEEFEVSAMPVREALRQLASEEALIGAAKKAYRVPDLSPDEAANLFFVRSILEGAAAELAVENMTARNLRNLARLATETDAAWATGQPDRYIAANYKFHRCINDRAGNTSLEKMIAGLYARTGPWLAHGVADLISADTAQDGHRKIVDAFASKDAALARRLVEDDAQWAITLYRRLR